MISRSPTTTKKIAALLAKEILRYKNKLNSALVIGLAGDLGSGKTTFIQGVARQLGIKHQITSPTFLIIRNNGMLYHIDCYRIKKPKELLSLNFKKIIANPKNIVLVEWADKIKKILPKNIIWINFEHGRKENERTIKISKS